MELRPQAHDIIRTWLFTTILRSHLDHNVLPWRHAAISGWVLDPDRKKMSKSKGNVVTPMPVLEQYGSDAVRYWAASARLGIDTAFDEGQIKVGRRLAIKILNASRFALSMDASPAEIVAPVDRSMLGALRTVVAESTAAFQSYEHARALELTERFFWAFTDDYLELVKQRAYGARGPEGAGSAVAALRAALDVLLRSFAPFLPYVTEEVWSWWHEGSVHRAPWPAADELASAADAGVYEVAAAVLTAVRRHKALEKVSLRTPCTVVTVYDSAERLALLSESTEDLLEAGTIQRLETAEGDVFRVDTVLASPDAAAKG